MIYATVSKSNELAAISAHWGYHLEGEVKTCIRANSLEVWHRKQDMALARVMTLWEKGEAAEVVNLRPLSFVFPQNH